MWYDSKRSFYFLVFFIRVKHVLHLKVRAIFLHNEPKKVSLNCYYNLFFLRLPLGVTSFSAEGLWLAQEITFQNGTRIWQPRRVPHSFCSYCGGNRKGENPRCLHHRRSPAASSSRISQKMCYQRGGRTTLIQNCLPQRNCPYFKITCRFKHEKSFSPPPTVSLLGSRLFWMYHRCWMSTLKKCLHFIFPGLQQQLQPESSIYLHKARASLTFNTGHKNITIKALKSAVKHEVTCHWDLLLLLLLLYPLLMVKQRLISKPPKKMFSIKLPCSTKLALLKVTTLLQCWVTSFAICRLVFLTI